MAITEIQSYLEENGHTDELPAELGALLEDIIAEAERTLARHGNAKSALYHALDAVLPDPDSAEAAALPMKWYAARRHLRRATGER